MKGDPILLLNRTPDGDILDAAVDGIMYSRCSDPAFLEVDFVVAAQISNISSFRPIVLHYEKFDLLTKPRRRSVFSFYIV